MMYDLGSIRARHAEADPDVVAGEWLIDEAQAHWDRSALLGIVDRLTQPHGADRTTPCYTARERRITHSPFPQLYGAALVTVYEADGWWQYIERWGEGVTRPPAEAEYWITDCRWELWPNVGMVRTVLKWQADDCGMLHVIDPTVIRPDVPDEYDAPYDYGGYGPHLWQVCKACDYNRHTCPGCGTHIRHGESACPSCVTFHNHMEPDIDSAYVVGWDEARS